MKSANLRALMLGNALEYYDFFLYSFFVSILSPLFFPSTDPLTALMMGFGAFAVGFLSRPAGALVFGHWGDKYGRKDALFWTLFLMAASTVGIGLLPTYEQIGISAPILLILFRLLQGFAAGGEVNGAAVFGLEQTISSKQGFVGALIKSSTGIGVIFATTMGLLFINELMPKWSWRIPFCLGGFVALSGLYLRRNLEETEVQKALKIPLLDVIENHFISFLKALGVGSFLHVPFYIVIGYMNPTLHAKGLISTFELMAVNTIITLIGVTVMPLIGYFSDRVGQRCIMTWSILAQIALALPFFIVYSSGSIFEILLAEIGFVVLCEAFVAPSSAYFNTLFPPECRYSGVAFADSLGIALFGGTTPIICSQLAKIMGPLGPSLYLLGTAFLGLLAIAWKTQKSFNHSSILEHSPEPADRVRALL